jgi:phospholipid/cholesterol/gamma-HCH transport system permease protein
VTDNDIDEDRLALERRNDEVLIVHLNGRWTFQDGLPDMQRVYNAIEDRPPRKLAYEADGLEDWNSGLLTVLVEVEEACKAKEIEVDASGLPQGVRKLVALATAVPERGGGTSSGTPLHFLERFGGRWLDRYRSSQTAIGFIGEAVIAFGKLLIGRANFRRSDLVLYIQQCGAQALPIVALISVLIGMILAFVGSVQLKLFGAQIFVANLVSIAMVREMGAMMTAIIMAGRTGASFAAQLGTMQVNEEIDALRTLGIAPMEFLVLPRMLALIIMMPLLCIYANVIGIFGGYIVGVEMLGLSASQYIQQTLRWLNMSNLSLGLGKSIIFGVIIAICGCYAGLQSGRSAAAVGGAATAAVVTAIVWIIVADGIVAVITATLGI